MKETKLISMTDFVLEQKNAKFKNKGRWDEERLSNIINYANFLKQPLKLEMFVPCDDDGNVLEEPNYNSHKSTWQTAPFLYNWKSKFNKCFSDYMNAKEKVLFDGFEVKSNPRVEGFKYIGFEYYEEPLFIVKSNNEIVRPLNKSFHTIEDLVKYNLTLTENALKIIGQFQDKK